MIFCRQRGSVGCVGWNHINQSTLIGWTPVHTIIIKTRDDFINEIQRPWFNHTFGDSWSDTWPHKDTPMKIEWPKSKRSGIRIMGSWPTDFARSQPSKAPSANQTDLIFHDNFSINRHSFSLWLNFWLKCEEIKHFWSKILSSTWSPLRSRLNCDHIEAGLITNRCKNRLESPLERQMHVEEGTREILFNPYNLKPNLHVDELKLGLFISVLCVLIHVIHL